jgi:riboflavin kinase/FMN adenylyltransferase
MEVIADKLQLARSAVPSAVAIGIFDGVHLGHQALLLQMLATARELGLRSLVYTFNPHPAQVLRGAYAPRLMEPISRRLQRLAALGVDAVWVEPFDRAFAATTADAYVRQTLVEMLQARHIYVGTGFTFGTRQSGNVAFMHELSPALNFAVHPVELLTLGSVQISSTLIRVCLRSGDVVGAGTYLGHPCLLEGTVVHGARRGSKMGFGTANLQPENELMPATGVYAGRAHTPRGTFVCVINIGIAPTFADSAEVRIEAHLLDYDGAELYGAKIELELHTRLRAEQKFASVAALLAQIQADVVSTQKFFAAGGPAV